jgi:DNA-binding LacI/PurR family transcriptional regulator
VPVLAKWFLGKVIGEAAQTLREAGFDVLLFELATLAQRERFFGGAHLHGRTDGVIIIALQPTGDELESLLPRARQWRCLVRKRRALDRYQWTTPAQGRQP